MRRVVCVALAMAAGCKTDVVAIDAAAAGAGAGPGAGAGARAGAGPQVPIYPPGILSLMLKRSIVVRFAADETAKAIGTVEWGTRVRWNAAAAGPGCSRWVEILPRGWICDKYLEPSVKPPGGEELPRLHDGELVPGVYGKVAGTGVTVRQVAEIKVGARTYWKTLDGKKIDARRIRVDEPSRFEGLWLDGMRLPIAWAQSRKKLAAPVAVRAAPAATASVVDKLAPRTVVPVEGESPDHAFARVGEDRWIARADLHVARAGEPPADLSFPTERWIDVDLDEQVLVAHEGSRPVFATLVSTGNQKWPTPSGIYRVWLKFDETDMSGQMGDEQAYSVATVPWTMYFAKDFAFHTAYWHDRFGEARSHGCVNLSPGDARTLYHWARPDVPLGWSMVNGYLERPGSLVKIHSQAAPAVEYRGYAKHVHELQQRGG